MGAKGALRETGNLTAGLFYVGAVGENGGRGDLALGHQAKNRFVDFWTHTQVIGVDDYIHLETVPIIFNDGISGKDLYFFREANSII